MLLSPRLYMPYMKKQVQWISRTVMVKDNDVDEAMQVLNGIMTREGMLKRWRGTRYYEKPTQVILIIQISLSYIYLIFISA